MLCLRISETANHFRSSLAQAVRAGSYVSNLIPIYVVFVLTHALEIKMELNQA
jgi:hypothetical protein